jgi:hypothetical protein
MRRTASPNGPRLSPDYADWRARPLRCSRRTPCAGGHRSWAFTATRRPRCAPTSLTCWPGVSGRLRRGVRPTRISSWTYAASRGSSKSGRCARARGLWTRPGLHGDAQERRSCAADVLRSAGRKAEPTTPPGGRERLRVSKRLSPPERRLSSAPPTSSAWGSTVGHRSGVHYEIPGPSRPTTGDRPGGRDGRAAGAVLLWKLRGRAHPRVPDLRKRTRRRIPRRRPADPEQRVKRRELERKKLRRYDRVRRFDGLPARDAPSDISVERDVPPSLLGLRQLPAASAARAGEAAPVAQDPFGCRPGRRAMGQASCRRHADGKARRPSRASDRTFDDGAPRRRKAGAVEEWIDAATERACSPPPTTSIARSH